MELDTFNKDYYLIKPHHLLDFLYDLAINYTHEGEENPYGSNNGVLCLLFIKGFLKKIKFTPNTDDICKPCKNLLNGELCLDKFDDKTTELYGYRSKHEFNYNLDIKLNNCLPHIFRFDIEQNMIDVLHLLENCLTKSIVDLYLWERPERYKKTTEGIVRAIETYSCDKRNNL